MKNDIALADDAIASVFDMLAEATGAITDERFAAYTAARDAILARHGITLQDYLTWCDDQEAAN